MTMACKRATELMSLSLDRPLTLPEKGSLRMHLMMCRHCRRCNRQFEVMHRITSRRREDQEEVESKPPE